MLLTVRQAAEATGKSKPTLLRAIQNGKLSATRHEITGAWMIDPAELHRAYPPDTLHQERAEPKTQDAAAHEAAILRRELAIITAERERERFDKDQQIAALSQQLAEANEERRTTLRQLTALLTDQRGRHGPEAIITPPPVADATPTPKARHWWSFGKRASA
jgi:excisionase family DNA binding protein